MKYATLWQSRELDRLMVEEFGVSIEMMMESAGYRLAEFLRGSKSVLIICGKGNNGGDGLSAARHLTNFGVETAVYMPQGNRNITFEKVARKSGVRFVETIVPDKYDVVLDCLIGYGLKGDMKYTKEVELLENYKGRVVACDMPSGVECDKGVIGPYIKCTDIVFLSLPKLGAKQLNCNKFVADIGVPIKLYAKIKYPEECYFKEKNIVSLHRNLQPDS